MTDETTPVDAPEPDETDEDVAAVDATVPDENPVVAVDLPDPEQFPSYDEVESEQGQSELPEDSFDESAAADTEPADEGCCV